MINVSNLFKEELNKGNRNYLAYAKCTLKDGTILDLDGKNIWSGGFGIEENVSSNNSFDIGSAIINKATIVINNIYDEYSKYDFCDCRVFLQVGLKLSTGAIEKVALGYFNVDEPKYNGALITLNCLDDMAKFDKPYSLSTLVYPATLLEIVQDACRKCGVVCGIASFENSSYVVQKRPNDSAITFRQMLAWIGQIACKWFKINKLGKLDCGWYKPITGVSFGNISGGSFSDSIADSVSGGSLSDGLQNSITGGQFTSVSSSGNTEYHAIDSITSLSVATDDLLITGVKVDEMPAEKSNKGASFLAGSEGYVIHIKGNKLILNGQAQVVANMIQRNVVGLRFRPINVSFQSNPTIEAGDSAIVTDAKGRTYQTLITRNRFEVGRTQTIECGAKFSLRNSASRFSKNEQDIIEIEQQIEQEKTDRENALQQLGQSMQNGMGLYTTIQKDSAGGNIYYLHDKPTLAESKAVWKMNSNAFAVSTDGGNTWNGGMTVDGDLITRILDTVGVNADWIRTGVLNADLIKGGIISDRAGKNTWNLETGEVRLERIDLKIESQDGSLGYLNKHFDSEIGALVTEIGRVDKVAQEGIEGANKEIGTLTQKMKETVSPEELKWEFIKERQVGATKVTTNTGFTFNDNGLTVDKVGASTKTQINENGMKVFEGNNAVLVADNQGVNARNLHATTYLIVGNNSRFEDYQGNRTACFFIG